MGDLPELLREDAREREVGRTGLGRRDGHEIERSAADELERLQKQLALAEEAMAGWKQMAELQAASGSLLDAEKGNG